MPVFESLCIFVFIVFVFVLLATSVEVLKFHILHIKWNLAGKHSLKKKYYAVRDNDALRDLYYYMSKYNLNLSFQDSQKFVSFSSFSIQ